MRKHSAYCKEAFLTGHSEMVLADKLFADWHCSHAGKLFADWHAGKLFADWHFDKLSDCYTDNHYSDNSFFARCMIPPD